MKQLYETICTKIKLKYETPEAFAKASKISLSKILKASGNEIGDLPFNDVKYICNALDITTEFGTHMNLNNPALQQLFSLDSEGSQRVYNAIITHSPKKQSVN